MRPAVSTSATRCLRTWCNRLRRRVRVQRRPAGEHRAALPGLGRRGLLESRALSPLMRNYKPPSATTAWSAGAQSLRRVVPGRLGGEQPPDAEHRRPLGRRHRHAREKEIDSSRGCRAIVPTTPTTSPRVWALPTRLYDRTVIRGGYGLFFTQLEDDGPHQSQLLARTRGAPGPQRRPPRFCGQPVQRADADVRPGRCQPVPRQTTARDASGGRSPSRSRRGGAWTRSTSSFSHMASIGVQRQLGAQMAFESNYVFTGGRKEESPATST